MNNLPNIYISPINLIIYEAIELFINKTGINIGYILSLRQHNVYGGYTNATICEKIFNDKNRIIERDHFCVTNHTLQENIKYDANKFHLIHLDQWFEKKSYKNDQTLEWIESFLKENDNLLFEIGTEDYIKILSTDNYLQLITLLEKYHNHIAYIVCQGGSIVFDLQNISPINELITKDFIELGKKFNFKVKRHNCDFHTIDDLKKLKSMGVNAFNFAPEFSFIYNKYVYELLSNDEIKILKPILEETAPWDRWIYNTKETDKLFMSCLHYIQHPIIDYKAELAKENITNNIISKLTELSAII